MDSKISFSRLVIVVISLSMLNPAAGQFRNKRKAVEVAGLYYVSPSGDDGNAGTIGSPWRTLQHAADSISVGDVLQVRAGVYRETLQIRKDGRPDLLIQFEAYPGETPVIEGREFGQQTCVSISGSYVKFKGFEIRNGETGLEITGHHIEISSCQIHDFLYGISPHDGAHDFTLRNVDLYHFLLYGFDASSWGPDEPECHGGFFYECTAHDCLDPEQNVDGFAFGDGHDFVFDHCSVFNVYDGFDIKADNTKLERCSASGCFNGGYKLWGDNIQLINCLGYENGICHVELDWDGTPGESSLINCTFVHSTTFGIWIENSRDHLQMFNCILADGENIGLCIEQGGAECYEGSHNIFHNRNRQRAIAIEYTDEFSLDQIKNGEWALFSGQDQYSSVSEDPDTELFLNMNDLDYHLFAESLAVDKASSAHSPSADYDCMVRPAGAAPDIGAYEYGSTLDPNCSSEKEVSKEKKGKQRR
jgi:hypothetical protein